MSEMVERVARAIARKRHEFLGGDRLATHPEINWGAFIAEARAAIEAISLYLIQNNVTFENAANHSTEDRDGGPSR